MSAGATINFHDTPLLRYVEHESANGLGLMRWLDILDADGVISAAIHLHGAADHRDFAKALREAADQLDEAAKYVEVQERDAAHDAVLA